MPQGVGSEFLISEEGLHEEAGPKAPVRRQSCLAGLAPPLSPGCRAAAAATSPGASSKAAPRNAASTSLLAAWLRAGPRYPPIHAAMAKRAGADRYSGTSVKL